MFDDIPQIHSPRFPTLILLCVAMLWGTSYGVSKEALNFLPVLYFLWLRFALTCLFLVPLVWRKIVRQDWIRLLPTGGLLFLIFICETYGVNHTSASNAAFLISLFVIFTPIVESVWLKVKLTPRVMLAASVSIIGVFLLTGNRFDQFTLGAGDGLMLLAALLRGIIVVKMKQVLSGKGQGIDSAIVSFVQSTQVLILISLFIAGGTLYQSLPSIPSDLHFWGYTIYLVIFCTLFAFLAQNYAVSKVSATQVSFLMGLEPVFGALFAYLYLGELFSLMQLLGAGCIISATLVVSWNKSSTIESIPIQS